MTLIYESDLKILKVYLHTRNELPRSWLSKIRLTELGLQTDIQTGRLILADAFGRKRRGGITAKQKESLNLKNERTKLAQ